jgi:hypothetical protein
MCAPTDIHVLCYNLVEKLAVTTTMTGAAPDLLPTTRYIHPPSSSIYPHKPSYYCHMLESY